MYNKTGTPRTQISRLKQNSMVEGGHTLTNVSKAYSTHAIPQTSHNVYRGELAAERQQVKNDIKDIVSSLQAKRQANVEALRQVQLVNSQILSSLGQQPNTWQKEASSSSHRKADDSQLTKYSRPTIDYSNVQPVHDLEDRLQSVERENQELRTQNAMLRRENQRLRVLPEKIVQELEALKRENQTLRTNTVHLLKKQKLI